MRIYYSLTTVDPVILSQTTATTNNHECLDYIPGSTILGALAAQLYSSLDEQSSWAIFHSGAVQFGPSYPVADQQLALPIPACWHFEKDKKAFDGNKLNQAELVNQAHPDFERTEGVQYKQCRNGYISSSGETASVEQGLSVKTAINRETGIAKDGSLFSYAYLEAKQTFIGWIDSDNLDYLNEIKSQLSGQFSLGRSRNTEFGRVDIHLLDEMPVNPPKVMNEVLTIWCLSDCQCLNSLGLPTFVPELNQLVPGAQGALDSNKSFIRTSKVSRFNQKRQGFDSEQLLISKGSVLVYHLDAPLSAQQLNDLQQSGIGINRQQGLGWVMVNPAWADNAHLTDASLFTSVKLTASTQPKYSNSPTSDLTRWIANRCEQETSAAQIKDEVQALLTQIGQAYRNARQYNHILNSYEVGPSSSQWRRISDELRNHNHDWKTVLFDKNHGICKAQNDELGWGISWDNGQGLITFADFMQFTLSNQSDKLALSLLSRINRYDFSTFAGLKKAAQELNFTLVTQPTTQTEAQS